MDNSQTTENSSDASPEQVVDQNISREARLQGWVEEDQYRGNPEDWVDAETFVKRGREVNPILRANNKRLVARIDEIARQNDELKTTLTAFGKHHEETAAKAYEQALITLRKEKKEAIDSGDTTEALKLADRIEDLKDSQVKAVEKAKPTARPAPAPGIEQDPTLTVWAKENTWFGAEKVKTQLAITYGEELHQEFPDLRGKPFLEELEARLVAEFPSRFPEFGNPRRTAPSMTAGRGGRSRTKTFADLPPEAQAACNKFVKQKLLTPEQYVKDYFSEEETNA